MRKKMNTFRQINITTSEVVSVGQKKQQTKETNEPKEVTFLQI